MGLVDDLVKLEALRVDGVLTDSEFAQAKAKILGRNLLEGEESLGQHLSEQLAEVRYQNELTRIDREWSIQREHISSRIGMEDAPYRR